MSTERDRAFKKALCESAALPEPRPAAAFWQDFRARASLTVQQAPVATASRDGAPGGRAATSQLWVSRIDAAAIDAALDSSGDREPHAERTGQP